MPACSSLNGRASKRIVKREMAAETSTHHQQQQRPFADVEGVLAKIVRRK